MTERAPLSPLDQEIPTRVRAFAGRLSRDGVALPFDPYSATARQVALVLADIRSWNGAMYFDADDNEVDDPFTIPDAELIRQYRNSVGTLDVVDYSEEQDDLYLAWIAILTEPGHHHSWGIGQCSDDDLGTPCDRCGWVPTDSMDFRLPCPWVAR